MHGTAIVERYASDFRNGVFVCAHVSHDTADAIHTWAQTLKLPKGATLVDPDEYHATLIHSKTPFDYSHDTYDSIYPTADATNKRLEVLGADGEPKVLTLRFDSHDLTIRHNSLKDQGGVSDFPTYKPHITIAENVPEDHDTSQHEVFAGPIVFTSESAEPIEPDRQKDFDEGKHPRDEHGRWTDGGGGGESVTLPKLADESEYPLPQSMTEAGYARAATHVDGLEVLADVPNTSSIGAELGNEENYTELPGIREVPFAYFMQPPSKSERNRNLAEAIKESGQINPLIVVIDNKGPYILEGSHRYSALQLMGKTKFPAVVVVNHDEDFDLKDWDEGKHPRVPAGSSEGGQFGEGGGGDGGDTEGHPGPGYSKDARLDKRGVIHTSNVYDAQRALFENRKVELKQPKQVATLIKLLGQTMKRYHEQGEAPPLFDLCNVTIKGTNLFCAETKGIPRVEMPQMNTKQTKAFIQYLKDKGYKVEKDRELASHLRATQNQLSAEKVVINIERNKDEPERLEKRLVVSRDNYIVDGHHHWAAKLALDAKDNKLDNDTKMRVSRVDIDIITLLDEAEKFTGGKGKKPAGKKDFRGPLALSLDLTVEDCEAIWQNDEAGLELGLTDREIELILLEWDESQHPRVPAGSPDGGQFGEGGGGGGEGEGEGEGTRPDDAEREREAAHVKLVLHTGRAVAKELGYDPSKVSIGRNEATPGVKFTLNGKEYLAAGLAYTTGPMQGAIKLFPQQITEYELTKGVTAHEVEHQKFQTALDKYQKEAAAMMADPGPPPNPNSEHWWEQRGGKDAVMRPDGTLWPPYDKKYPNYQAMEKNFRTYSWDEFADADGVSGYSYEYWKGFKQATVKFELAVHETLAEMGRIKYETGKFPNHYGEGIIAYRGEDKPKPPQSVIDANAKRWRDLYRTVEKVYKGTA